MKPCEYLTNCRQNVKDCKPEGTYLEGRVMLAKHVCMVCGRVWAEVYLESGIIVDLTTERNVKIVSSLETQREVTGTALLRLLENINSLKVSDRDEGESE